MNTAFTGLFLGLLVAILLIYPLIVVNFQSWLDPFVIITALPAALAGIVWILFATGTTSVRSRPDRRHHVHGRGDGELILVISFARERLSHRRRGLGRDRSRRHAFPSRPDDRAGHDHRHGADGAGPRRRRRAECARSGRAVIGGLLFATCATLLFVPVVFSIVHGRRRSNLQDHRTARQPIPEKPMPDDPHEILRRRPLPHLKTIGIVAAVHCLHRRRGRHRRASAPADRRTGPTPKRCRRCRRQRQRRNGGRPACPAGQYRRVLSAPVHARATGYLKRWYTDIGARVKAGDAAAEIDTPDLDQQLAQAKANLGTGTRQREASTAIAAGAIAPCRCKCDRRRTCRREGRHL